MNSYGVILNGTHVDVANTEKGAKIFATKHGYDTVSIRYNGGYIAKEIAYKNRFGKWVNIPDGHGQTRYSK